MLFTVTVNFIHRFQDAWQYMKDLREFDPVLTKVMLYMCPTKELHLVLKEPDPILSTSYLAFLYKGREKTFKEAQVYVNIQTLRKMLQ